MLIEFTEPVEERQHFSHGGRWNFTSARENGRIASENPLLKIRRAVFTCGRDFL